ncbi:MAG: hypothetical protein ACR2KC_05560 [Acidimicrobiales bacterium]
MTSSAPSTSARPPAEHSANHQNSVKRGWTISAAVLLGAGLFFHLLALTGTPIDSDEAIAGLLARHVAHGDWRVFFWGQSYGGTLDAFFLAPFLVLAPGSVFALSATSLVEAPAIAYVVYRISTRYLPREQAVFVGCAAYCFPAFAIPFSTAPELFYNPIVLLGLLLVLMSLRVVERPSNLVNGLLWGLLGGVGWWLGPTIVIFAIPAFAWAVMFSSRRVPLRLVGVATIGFLVGALPWLVYNVMHPLASFHGVPRVEPYSEHARSLLTSGLPTLFNLKIIDPGDWVITPVIGIPASILMGVLLAVLCVGMLRRRHPLPAVLVVGLVVVVFIPTSYTVANGRYIYYLAAPLAAVVASAGKSRRARRVLTAVIIASTALWFTQFGGFRNGVWTTVSHLGSDHIGAAAVDYRTVKKLESLRATRLFADYWQSYKYSFLSDERIVFYSFVTDRSRSYDASVMGNADPAYLFPAHSLRIAWLEARLTHLGVRFDKWDVENVVVIRPRSKVLPQQLLANPLGLSELVPASLLGSP